MRSFTNFLGTLLRDLTGLSGIVMVSYGSWLTYKPAGFIIGGLLLLGLAITMARNSD